MAESPPSPAIFKVFLSCVTNEFLPHREMLAKDLSLPQVKVQVQEDFIQGGHSTLEKLDDYIRGCAAVIHLVGFATGSRPSVAEVGKLMKKYSDFGRKLPLLQKTMKSGMPSLSYTQWEAWLAIYHNVPCYVYRAEPTALRSAGFTPDAAEMEIQDGHWARFESFGKDRKTFADEQHLCRSVLRSLSAILPSGTPKGGIIFKGLRSFDASDCDFFLELLPGPRDNEGLPDSIRFWKHRIESTRPGFSVGVMFGPSGCGKSSLVKAGLVPRLAPGILTVQVEATAGTTEASLLGGLRKGAPGVPGDLSLVDLLARIRKGDVLKDGQKILIIIDQFEQWLHANRTQQESELVRALRMCDGDHIACILLVRDDFWMGISRLLGELSIDLLQGQNAAVVDLFDVIHARRVLAAFGQAFGSVDTPPTKDQEAFIERAIEGLSQDGRVISVRLALLAQMLRGRTWTPATLKALGGTEGIGVAFLEETFSSPAASPANRFHQEAARAVLKALLPEHGADIRGNMRSRDELSTASGYAKRPADFEGLLRILDTELRLITPTQNDDATTSDGTTGRCYQLTHDYLVPSIQDWLTRKQKETRKGRAELAVANLATVWNYRKERRQLPSFLEWIQIRLFTSKWSWTDQQRVMMRRATRHHALRGLVACATVAIVVVAGLVAMAQASEQRKSTHAAGLVQGLLKADTAQVPTIINEMAEYRKWTDPQLRIEYDRAESDSPQKLHVGLALLGGDASKVDFLYGRLLDARPGELAIIVDALTPHSLDLLAGLAEVVERPTAGKESQRLRAAAALARYSHDRVLGEAAWAAVADDLVAVPSVHLSLWMDALRPARAKLLPQLALIYRAAARRETERSLATDILADFAAGDSRELADLLMDADENQFAIIYPVLVKSGGDSLRALTTEIERVAAPDADDDAKEHFARRQANAAAGLLKMNRSPAVWQLLKHRPDPGVRSHLIHKIGPLKVDARLVIDRLAVETDISVRRALVLCLGEVGSAGVPDRDRIGLVRTLKELYRSNPDPGLHGAAEWLLRAWGEKAWLEQELDGWATDRVRREDRIALVRIASQPGPSTPPPQWFVNGQRQTMVVIPGPVEFRMGSPAGEPNREGGPTGMIEATHAKRIAHRFAISAKETSVDQFLRFRKDYKYAEKSSPTPVHPVNGVTWYEAAEYCNWLSAQERIGEDQWCYEPNRDGKYAVGMKVKPDYFKLNGYRLPSEAEWEYACRAGAATSRYYGESDQLLGKYACYTKVSGDRNMLPPGTLKPNDFGLFDTIGNALEWCQESFQAYNPRLPFCEDVEDGGEVKGIVTRSLRGSSFVSLATSGRCANRYKYEPAYTNINVGFRTAKTLR